MTAALLLSAVVKNWKLAVGGSLMIVMLVLGLAARHYAAAASSARVQLATVRLEASTIRADAATNDAAMSDLAAKTQATEISNTLIRSQIDALPSTSDCARSPAINALLTGLRSTHGSASSSATAHKSSHVHRGAITAEAGGT